MTNGEADGVVLAEESPSNTGGQLLDGENNGADKSTVAMDTVAVIAAPKPRDQTTTPDDFICAVCYELPISATDSLVTSCCHHLFCKGCIAQSIRSNNACPFCRVDLTTTADMKPLDGIARRVFESVQVTCSREACSWEGCVGAYLGHAEECSVSMVSKIELGRMLRQSRADLQEKTRLHEKCKGSLGEMVNRLQDELDEKAALVDQYKQQEQMHARFKGLICHEVTRLEEKVDSLMEEKAGFILGHHNCDSAPKSIFDESLMTVKRMTIESEKGIENMDRKNWRLKLASDEFKDKWKEFTAFEQMTSDSS